MGTGSSLRIGIVGLGTIGRIHAERIVEAGASVAGADLDEDARRSFEAEFDASVYADHGALLDTGVDAVIVGVPNRFHEEIAIDALEAGVDVLVEKPLAHSVESAERIAAAARRSEATCMVGFTMRHSALTEETATLAAEGQFGSISHVSVEYLRRGGVPGGGEGWFTDPDLAGGGVLMDLGVHVIDLALYLHGYPDVVEVTGQTRSEFGSYDVDDSATALIRCADGRTISIDTSWHGTCPGSNECTVRGTEAGATFDILTEGVTVFDADPERDPETIAVEPNDMHSVEDREFLEAVAENEGVPGGTVEQAVTVQRVIDAIYTSSERGSAVAFATAYETGG